MYKDGDAMAGLKGKALTIRFEIEGQQFLALNDGPRDAGHDEDEQDCYRAFATAIPPSAIPSTRRTKETA
jgi:predicted 3-demethylubiquinone-9 3-methyltransferase (glyoxalase superfamily)